MSSRLRIELEVARSDSAPRPRVLSAPADVKAGEALDVLGEAVGLSGAAGAVQARSLLCGGWVDREARLSEVGLLRGERLSLTVGLRPSQAPRPLSRWGTPRRGDDSGRVPVNRPPRAVRPQPELTLGVPTRRQHRKPRRFPLGAILIPLGLGVVLGWVTGRWEILLFALFTPVMALWNHLEERRAQAEEIRDFGRTYAEEVDATLERIRGTARDWTAWLHQHHPSPAEVADIARTLGPRLWERQPGDPDFLSLRLGKSQRRAPVTIRQDEASRLVPRDDAPDYEGATRVEDVPVTVELTTGSLAVVGTDDQLDRELAWLVLQLVTLHSPAEVQVAGAFRDAATCDWFRWLPHVAHNGLDAAAVVDHDRGADQLLDAVNRLAVARRTARNERSSAGNEPRLVVFVDGRLQPDATRLSAAQSAQEAGVSVVWVGSRRTDVPTSSAYLLTLDADGAELLAHRGGHSTRLAPELLGRSTAVELSSFLAPARDAADSRRVRSVPDRVSLESLVPELTSPSAMRRRWKEAPLDRLVAKLGLGADGAVELDLGPFGSHALVGGTTGSGKSELLQAMVASIAADYPPGRVGFLLVDYKGGAAFKDAMKLPHCVGVVTDLDEHLTRRVLVALDAEIKRREELLAEHGARDVTELRRTTLDAAPADLLIVVDEFATLAKEIPEFVEGVVDLAARGRSLGLRLVLATQRPAGVINDRIRANVGVRIALRVNDEADSGDVIDSREAAHISRDTPGRAYLKVHREVTEFQSAFVGAPVRREGGADVEASPLWSHEVRSDDHQGGPTTLEAVVDTARNLMRVGRWNLPHVPWLPALPEVLTAADLEDRTGKAAPGSVLLALADLPSAQTQRVVAFDLAQQRSMLVFGTSRSGKTTLLRTIAAGLVESMGPEEVEVYGLDFAGNGLQVLEGSPQVPGITGGDEPGRVVRLLRRLGAAVEERKRLLAASGTGDFSTLQGLPRLVVLLDSYSGATSALERLDGGRVLERLERLIVDGPTVGLHFVITADRRAAVPSALTSVVTTRVVLKMAEKDDYALLGVDPSVSRDARLPAGRGFIQGATEIQVAVRASADTAAEHDALRALVGEAAERWPKPARRLGRMPGKVDRRQLPPPPQGLVLPFAVGDLEVTPVALDLRGGSALVAGPSRSGRSSTLATLADIAAGAPEPPALAAFLARRSPLASAVEWAVGPVDATSPDHLSAASAQVRSLLSEGRTVICFVDDVDALPDPASALLEELLRLSRDHHLRMVAAADSRWALRAYGGLVTELRKSKQGVLLAPEIELDGDLLGVRLRPPFEAATGAGRGFLVRAGAHELVQIAHPARS